MISRLILPKIQDSKKSILLLGPRQVGKSTAIRSLKPDLTFNLADEDTYLDFVSNSGTLKNRISEKKVKTIFIDEIQRVPSLLNTVQSIIDESKIKFYLTGSSARKLRRGGANLLPGRVINYNMGPVCLKELDYKIENKSFLRYGFLPEVLNLEEESEKKELLNSYTQNYLIEEIKAESLTRSLEAFSRFLLQTTKVVGSFIDYTKISKIAKISRHSCPNYFEILEDTMLGFRIFPNKYLLEVADLVKHPKFYFFDPGVLYSLEKKSIFNEVDAGVLSEQIIFSQLRASAQALNIDIDISLFRTRGGVEVDFIVEKQKELFGIEVKTSDQMNESETYGLHRLRSYIPKSKNYIFHFGKKDQKINDIWCLPWTKGFKEIGF